MSEKTIREYDRLILRLPDGMRERIAESANRNSRSMNAEAVSILDEALPPLVGSLLTDAEREQRVIEQQLEVYEASLRDLRERHAEAAARVSTLRRENFEADTTKRPFVVKPRPRPKGQFVPTKRD